MKTPSAILAGLTLGLSLSVARSADLREGLVSYWPLDTLNSTTFTTPDVVSGNDFNAFSHGPTDVVAGRVGSAFQFSPDFLQYLEFTNPEGVDTGLPVTMRPRWTVMFWVNATYPVASELDRRVYSDSSSTTDDPLVNIGTDNDNDTDGGDQTVDLFIRNSGTQVNHVHGARPVFDGTWRHVALVDAGGTLMLYVDGEVDSVTPINYTPGPTPRNVTSVGAVVRQSGANIAAFFRGRVDEVAVWERDLSQDEVKAVIASGIQTPVPDFSPFVTQDPTGATNLVVGDTLTLSAGAGGSRPLTYQWLKDGAPITGATANTLTLADLQATDSGDYVLRVSNAAGAATSGAATLIVNELPAPNLTNGLVAFWPLEEVQGTRTPDVVGGYDMTLVGLTEADLVDGRWGKAFRFTAARSTMLERENLPEDALSLYSKHPNFTVSIWVNGPAFQQDKRIFSEASSTVNTPLFNLGTHNTAANGAVDIYIRDDANQQGGHRFSTIEAYTDTWHHVLYVQREVGGVMQASLYIDGVRDEIVIDPRRPLTANTTSIGGIRRGSAASPARSFYFEGMLDDVALWSRALSEEEIALLYTQGTPRPSGTEPQPLVIRSFKADRPAAGVGDSMTLRWDVSKDTTRIEITPGVGDVTGQSSSGVGSVAVPITTSQTFTLTITRGTETLSATTSVSAIDSIADGWSLLDNFDRYDVGPFPSTYWGDLGGNSQIVEVAGNRLLDMRGTARIALMSLNDLKVTEGQQRSLFVRLYPQGDPAAAVRSLVGLTDRSLRFVTDASDAGGVGPAALPSNEAGDLMVGARFGVAGVRAFVPPVLEANTVYSVWIDVRNDPVAVGDTFSIWMQKAGDPSRTQLFDGYVSDRDPNGDPPGAGGAPTKPDLDKVFVGNDEANAVFFDDLYISRSGYSSTVPRVFGFTTPVGGAAPSLTISRAGTEIEVTWSSGSLESATALTGPWDAVAATSPYRTPTTGSVVFYRARQ